MGTAPRGELIRRLALTLQALHHRQVIHRDLKPHNIMLRGNDEPMLMDFGLARDLSGIEETLTSTGLTPGTPRYMAPEQIEGDREALAQPPTPGWLICGTSPDCNNCTSAGANRSLTSGWHSSVV